MIERFHPRSEVGRGKVYLMGGGAARLSFVANFPGSEVDIVLNGQPSDYEFFYDTENEVLLVHKKFHWISTLRKGEEIYSRVQGFFTRTRLLEDGVEFTDEDALISGPDTPIAAACYGTKDGELMEAELVGDAIKGYSRAEQCRLLPFGAAFE